MQQSFSVTPQLLKDLRAAISQLPPMNPWHGFWRFTTLGLMTISLAAVSWHSRSLLGFALGAIATSIVYAFWLICNHDATHRTLTGWTWFDLSMPRLVSWPMLWPVGVYNQLHRLHHGWNGLDLRDPERVQWTAAEYEAAPFWQRWYVRHQWIIDIFVFGGIGLIVKTLLHGIELQSIYPQLRKQLLIDVVGMFSIQGLIIGLLYLQSISLWKYLLFWFVIERSAGLIIQTRDHLEHYGMWQSTDSYQLTQLYACRNLNEPAWVNWLMGGLPYHSVHHAFPNVASAQLPEAFHRLQAVLEHHLLPPMALEQGYIATSVQLVNSASLINTGDTPATILTTQEC